MILLDADILLLDIRYPRDVRFSLNERLLKTLQERELERGTEQDDTTGRILLEKTIVPYSRQHIGILVEMETRETQTTLRQAQGERDRV